MKLVVYSTVPDILPYFKAECGNLSATNHRPLALWRLGKFRQTTDGIQNSK